MSLREIIEKVSKKPHRLTNLQVNEVSVVTEPAILSQEEADAGVGLPIIKIMADGLSEVGGLGGLVLKGKTRDTPVSAIRKFDLREDEDLWDIIAKLYQASRLALTVSQVVDEWDAYWYSPIQVTSSMVRMTDTWSDPWKKGACIYEMTYSRDAKGAFVMGEPKKFEVQFVEAQDPISDPAAAQPTPAAKTAPVVQNPCGEAAMKVQFGGAVHEVTLSAGQGVVDNDGNVIVRKDTNGSVIISKGWTEKDGVVQKAAIQVVETPPAAPVAAPVAAPAEASVTKSDIEAMFKQLIEQQAALAPAPVVAAPVTQAAPATVPVLDAEAIQRMVGEQLQTMLTQTASSGNTPDPAPPAAFVTPQRKSAKELYSESFLAGIFYGGIEGIEKSHIGPVTPHIQMGGVLIPGNVIKSAN